MDAQYYASEYDVSLEVAQDNLEIQAELAPHLSEYSALAGKRLIGATLTQGETIGISITVSGTSPINALTEIARSDSRVTVNYIEQPSRSTLESYIEDNLAGWSEKFPEMQGVYVDEQTGAIRIDITSTAGSSGSAAGAGGKSSSASQLTRDVSGAAPDGTVVQVDSQDAVATDSLQGALPLW